MFSNKDNFNQNAKRIKERRPEHELACIKRVGNVNVNVGEVIKENQTHQSSEGKLWSLLKMPFWQINNIIPNPNATTTSSSTSSSSCSSSANTSTTTSSNSLSSSGSGVTGGNNGSISIGNLEQNPPSQNQQQQERFSSLSTSVNAVSLVAKSLLPFRKRLRLDPPNKLYFPYETGKQVRSAIGIKNVCKSYVAFKFQTTSPKSCFMRPPGCILAPGQGLIATVFKFVEPPENNERPVVLEQKSRVKFKIMSLKVKAGTEYVPEMFDELKDQTAVEQILRVVFLDPESPTPALEKLKQQLAEAEAEVEARKKPTDDATVAQLPTPSEEGLVIDEWKERRERYLAQQHLGINPE